MYSRLTQTEQTKKEGGETSTRIRTLISRIRIALKQERFARLAKEGRRPSHKKSSAHRGYPQKCAMKAFFFELILL